MTTRTLLELKPAQILVHPSNPRRAVGDVSELAASLKAHGLLQNLVVAPRPLGMKGPKAAEYVLIAGHRRLAAAKRAKLDTVTSALDEGLTDPADQLSAMLVENGQREDLSPVEEAAGYQALLDLKVSAKDVARRVSRPSRHVADRVKLGRLPEDVKDKVHTHQVSLKEAMAITEFVGDDKVVATLTSALGGWNFEWEVNNARRSRARVEEVAKQRRDLVTAGVTILDERPPWPETDTDPEPVDLYDLWEYGDLSEEIVAHAGVDHDDLEEGHIVAWHQETCPHHAVVDQAPHGFQEICTNLAAHYVDRERPEALSNDTTPSNARTVDPAEVARREAEERLEEGLQTAAVVRRAAVAEVIQEGSENRAKTAILDLLAGERPKDPAVEGLQDWDIRSRQKNTGLVGAFLGLPEGSSYEVVVARFDQFVRSRSLAALTLLWVALDRSYDDDALTQPYGWQRLTWTRDLRDVFGYQWSDVERSLLPESFAPDAEVEGSEVV